jgi:oligopeptide/dipeptide ABC transporter ATP-binding protein
VSARTPAGGFLVEAERLTKHFPLQQGALARLLDRGGSVLRAVDDVSLRLRRGEAYGLIGESGCGKSTLGRLLLRLLEPTSGRIRFDGQDVTTLPEAALRPLRRRMQPVFQDAHAALNPAMTIGEAVMDGLRIHCLAPGAERERAMAALEEVGVSPAPDFFDRLPRDLSGGQKQRVVLARAMVLEPEFLVLDEPVSMLDMSVRAKVLELLQGLRRRHGLTMLFITHDLATARFLCDRVGIMYLGHLVEEGPAADVFREPLHPYTQALLQAIPAPDPGLRGLHRPLRGEVPDASRPPAGCRFHPRCPVSEARCGFTPEDLVEAHEAALAEGRQPRVPPPAQWVLAHQSARLPGASAQDVEALARHGAPGLRAAMEVRQEGRGTGDTTVRFPPAEPIAVRRLGPRSAMCLRHADAEHPAHAP